MADTISNAGLALAVAGGAGFYLAGKVHDDDHQRETGILAGEAAVNSLIVAESFKLISRRNGPRMVPARACFSRAVRLWTRHFPLFMPSLPGPLPV